MRRTKFPRMATILGALLLLGIIFSSFSWAAPPDEGHGDPAAGHEGGEAGEGHEVVPAVHEPEPHAAPPGGHGDGGPVFVTPPSSPTQVQLGMYLISLVEVSAPSESFPTFKAEMFVDVEWHDDRLAFDKDEVGSDKEVFLEHEAELELERIWWPDIEFENEQGERQDRKSVV